MGEALGPILWTLTQEPEACTLELGEDPIKFVEGQAYKIQIMAVMLIIQYLSDSYDVEMEATCRQVEETLVSMMNGSRPKKALYLMSVLDNDDESKEEDWLIKAVDAGSCKAMAYLGDFYGQGHGWFLLPWRRDHKAIGLYQQASKVGCPIGISRYARALDIRNGLGSGMSQWQRLIDQGDANTLKTLAMNYGDPSIIIATPKNKPSDLYRSALFFKIYLDGIGRVPGTEDHYDGMNYYLNKTMAKLSPQQQQKVLADAKTYLQHHELKNIDEIWEMKFQ